MIRFIVQVNKHTVECFLLQEVQPLLEGVEPLRPPPPVALPSVVVVEEEAIPVREEGQGKEGALPQQVAVAKEEEQEEPVSEQQVCRM